MGEARYPRLCRGNAYRKSGFDACLLPSCHTVYTPTPMVLGAGIGARACLAYSHSRAVLPMSGTSTWYARAIRPQGMNSRFFFCWRAQMEGKRGGVCRRGWHLSLERSGWRAHVGPSLCLNRAMCGGMRPALPQTCARDCMVWERRSGQVACTCHALLARALGSA